MKIYKVITGAEIDEYDNSVKKIIEKYFLNRAKAEELYKKGEYHEVEVHTTVTYSNGETVLQSVAPRWAYEEQKANATSNQSVELVETIKNHYRFEEIETED